MAIEILVAQLSWVLSLLGLLLSILILAICVCTRQTEKAYLQDRASDYGTAGRLSMTRDSPLFQHQVSNGTLVEYKSGGNDSLDSDDDGSLKRNSWVVKDRALPDIPDSSHKSSGVGITAVAEEKHSEHEQTNLCKKKTHNKHNAPKPPPEVSVIQLDKSLKNDHTHISIDSKSISIDGCHQSSSPSSLPAAHSHAWTQFKDPIPSTSDGSVVLSKIKNSSHENNFLSKPSSSSLYTSATNPYAEPHVGLSHTSSSPVRIHVTGSNTSSQVPACLAVAGAVPSSDIPYMTPPLLHNSAADSSNEESPQRIGSSLVARSEIPYTVISVREPLAKVREMTMKKQRAIQNSTEGENHYSLVPEEEQMYAEIGSGQGSGSSSITYAHIEPRELPPVPPTVESLKSVAHAHSRQASTVSTSSFGSCVSGSAETNTSPTAQLQNLSICIYSSVEKNAKQRRTIHIAEGASAISSTDRHKKVEDLYAKVRKKRVELTLSASSFEEYSGHQGISGNDVCITPPPSPWASTTPPAPPPITGRLQAASLCAATSQHMRRHSADPSLSEKVNEISLNDQKHLSYTCTNSEGSEPGYEQIYSGSVADDSCYEKIKDEFADSSKQGYESIHQPNVSFPNYATLKDPDRDSIDPGYECVQVGNESISSDPGYEPVRISLSLDENELSHGYTAVNLGEIEPNYETVKKLSRTESDTAEPGYERVKKLSRNGSDATDPGYERVKNKLDLGDPGYETVNQSDSDLEPGYEIVGHQSLNRTIHTSFCEGAAPSNSTILIISGEIHQPTNNAGDELETNATFL